MLLSTKLNDNERTAFLRELFLNDEKGIGVSYLRVSIGASIWTNLFFLMMICQPEKPIHCLLNSIYRMTRFISFRY